MIGDETVLSLVIGAWSGKSGGLALLGYILSLKNYNDDQHADWL